MTVRTYLKFLLVNALLICGATKNSNAQKANEIDEYPTVKEALNKKVWTSSKSYYTITKSTDSTVHLIWGNSSLKRMFNEDLEVWPAAEKVVCKMDK